MDKITVIYITPGPVYDTDSAIFKRKFIALSKCCRGYFLSTSGKNEECRMGDFHYSGMARGKYFLALHFLKHCVSQAWKIRKNGEQVDCVVTYDPLTTGLIGWFVKFIVRAKLVVEVNGVYTSPVVWDENRRSAVTCLKKMIVPRLMGFIFRVTDGVYLLFPDQVKQFHKVVQRKTVGSFPCWVPVSFFKNLGENKEILFVGFPLKVKGVDILIKAFKKVASDFPEWKLKILGWYPDIEELEKEIDSHQQIYHHEPVLYSEMPLHVGRCGILVLPSRTEAMGRVLVEAAAAGKPRIASDVDGIPTVINDNADGLLFESENIRELAEKMSLLMDSVETREKLGQAAQQRVSLDFSEELFVRNTVEFLKEVIRT